MIINDANFKIVLIEEKLTLRRCYYSFLDGFDNKIVTIESIVKGREYVDSMAEPAVLILDLDVEQGETDALDFIQYVSEISIGSKIICLTSSADFKLTTELADQGVIDVLPKPFSKDRLLISARNAIKQISLEQKVNPVRNSFEGFIGSSQVVQKVYSDIERSSSSKASVFITGESGTGKEVCAHAIHNLSPRKNNELVVLNCAAIPSNLMESEIFGHIKGAFTGANKDRTGAATRANGGTLFLDEIGEMDMELQSKLLRFIQTGTFSRVGSNEIEHVDIRFLSATNRDPQTEITEGRFREDLYYRLNVVPIHLPPLRKRGDDILMIAKTFLDEFSQSEGKEFAGFSSKVESYLSSYQWPGNIRQLRNVIHNVVILNQGPVVELDMLPETLKGCPNSDRKHGDDWNHSRIEVEYTESSNVVQFNLLTEIDPTGVPTETIEPLWKIELNAINRVIDLCDGNITQAAKLLEIDRSTIHRKLTKYSEILKSRNNSIP